jgi:hypothetical protein
MPNSQNAVAHRLRLLLKYLEKGEIPVKVIDLRKTLCYAAKVLTACSTLLNSERGRSVTPEPLSAVKDTVVREWLSSTFTRRHKSSHTLLREKPPSFKNVAKTLMIGKYIENIYKDRVQVKAVQYPEGVLELFQVCRFYIQVHSSILSTRVPLTLVKTVILYTEIWCILHMYMCIYPMHIYMCIYYCIMHVHISAIYFQKQVY